MARDPLNCVAIGSGQCLEEFEALQKVLISSSSRSTGRSGIGVAQPQDPRLRSGVSGYLHWSWCLLVHVSRSLEARLHSERQLLVLAVNAGWSARQSRRQLFDQQVASAGIRRRVPQLRHGPCLDLADALAGQVEALADLFQCPRLTAVEAET